MLVAGGLAGCSLPGQRADWASTDPAERTLAIGRAARAPDDESTRRLIVLLESDDPCERMLAIESLRRATGETFGFDYAAPERERRSAVARWVVWANEDGKSSGGDGRPGGGI